MEKYRFLKWIFPGDVIFKDSQIFAQCKRAHLVLWVNKEMRGSFIERRVSYDNLNFTVEAASSTSRITCALQAKPINTFGATLRRAKLRVKADDFDLVGSLRKSLTTYISAHWPTFLRVCLNKRRSDNLKIQIRDFLKHELEDAGYKLTLIKIDLLVFPILPPAA